MNMFLALKELLNKNIDCNVDMTNHIVFFLKKKKYLYLNKNIIVRDGTACVIVYRGKVRDVMIPGKYKINEQALPNTFEKAKREKANKKKKKIRKIRARIYYVNTEEFNGFDFESKKYFVLKPNEIGKIKGLSQGMCSLKIIDAESLIKYLLRHRKINYKKINKNIGIIVGNKINRRIQKEKISIDMLFNNNGKLNELLNTSLEDAYDSVGLYVKNIKLKSINFHKRSQKKINEYIESRNVYKTSSTITSANWSVGREVPKVPQSITMQNKQNTPNNSAKICHRCGFSNSTNAIVCRNCNTKF